MGNAPSPAMSHNGSNRRRASKHKRRPSKHSGKLYSAKLSPFSGSRRSRISIVDRAAPLPMTTPDCTYQTSEELKFHLPKDLQPYSSAIDIVYRFWRKEVEILNEKEYTALAVSLYTNIFKLFPPARNLFKKDIELQAKHFFGKFRWIILNLREPDTKRLMKSIKKLGKYHRGIGIKDEWYPVPLQALHQTLYDAVQDRYTSRIRFCFEQLYTVVANIMTDQDFESLSSEKISNFLHSLGKLEDCLNDEEGIQYLELYMAQQFCVELILFYKDYRRFKNCASNEQRQQIGSDMMSKYIDRSAECEINVSYGHKAMIYYVLSENQNVFSNDIFDECCAECLELMRTNIWTGFKDSILKMAVDEDIHFEERRNSRLLAQTPITLKIFHADAPSASNSPFPSCSLPEVPVLSMNNTSSALFSPSFKE
mmetsp:Transcript_66048/g.105109  ORF Transcript_66048/g.105109 Transcript_66048/m.105109 type:complete len:424 (-) Transcript_66048:201-1472(-)